MLILSGDHGCDPTTESTDHTRERTPLLAGGLAGGPYEIGTRESFADVGRTVADLLRVEVADLGVTGESFAGLLGARG